MTLIISNDFDYSVRLQILLVLKCLCFWELIVEDVMKVDRMAQVSFGLECTPLLILYSSNKMKFLKRSACIKCLSRLRVNTRLEVNQTHPTWLCATQNNETLIYRSFLMHIFIKRSFHEVNPTLFLNSTLLNEWRLKGIMFDDRPSSSHYFIKV